MSENSPNLTPLSELFRSPSDPASVNDGLGELPEWDLADLYAAMDAPELEADLQKAADDSVAFEKRWKGGLETAAHTDGDEGLGTALRQFEALEELMGRIVSYAGLTYFSDTTDPARAKFYGDIQTKITDVGSRLLFFPLELNRIEDGVIDAAMENDPAAAHYSPWLIDLRKDKPYQLEDRIEKLFHEKSVTGHGAWNRLFDETMAALRFTIDGEVLTLEPTLNKLQSPDGDERRTAAKALSKTFEENIRTFTLITNTLAKE
ncbi:hypothetical protein [Hoeflea sp.]|uniref:hypothetical protein n=1 Tax=Hoeflea sp. TaxID=1940281 RepID=UPI003B0219C5